MSRFTPDDLVTLTALVNVHIRQLAQLAKLESRPDALQKLGREQIEAEQLRDKLAAEYHDAMRIPGVTS